MQSCTHDVKIPVILAAPKLERQCGTVPKHVRMHTAVFVKIGMHIVKEDWHANSEGREQKWEGGTENKRGKRGRGTEKERREEYGNGGRFSVDKWLQLQQNTANISIDTFLLSLS